jgi:hypothetical protein
MGSIYQIDRRNYPRYRIDTYVEITTPEFFITVNTVEISLEGIRVEAYTEIKPGTKVTISFESAKKLLLHGLVVWVFVMQKKNVTKYLVGIQIKEMVFSGVTVNGLNKKEKRIQSILAEIKK